MGAAGVGFALATICGTVGAQPAPPQPPAAAPAVKPLSETLTGLAKAEYEAARIFYGDKDYANAIVKFERAYELSKYPRLLFNIAVCQKNLRRYAKMLATIKRYQVEAEALITAEDKEQAAEVVKTVEAFVSPLRLTASETGADVFVDGEKVGTTPLAAPVTVDVGVRQIKVTKPGFKNATRSLEVVGGGEVVVDLHLDKEQHRGRLVVVAGPKDLISIDGKAVGLARWEGSVPAGGHTLRVTAPGMSAYQSEAVVQDNQVRRIDVALNSAPREAGRAVYWVVGGAVLATAAVIGGVVLFKPSETAPVVGNISPGTVQLDFHGLHGLRGGHR